MKLHFKKFEIGQSIDLEGGYLIKFDKRIVNIHKKIEDIEQLLVLCNNYCSRVSFFVNNNELAAIQYEARE